MFLTLDGAPALQKSPEVFATSLFAIFFFLVLHKVGNEWAFDRRVFRERTIVLDKTPICRSLSIRQCSAAIWGMRTSSSSPGLDFVSSCRYYGSVKMAALESQWGGAVHGVLPLTPRPYYGRALGAVNRVEQCPFS